MTCMGICLKESGRRILLVVAVAAVCAGLLWVGFAQKEQESFVVSVGVVNGDDNALGEALQSALLRQTGVVALQQLTQEEAVADADHYAAILELPRGFTESVMTGENLPIRVWLNRSAPLEALWARQMLEQGFGALALGQQAVGVMADMTEQQGGLFSTVAYGSLAVSLNRYLLSAFSGGEGMMEHQQLRVTGDYTVMQYGAASVFVVSVMGLAFLFSPAVCAMNAFPLRKITARLAGLTHALVLCVGLCMGFCLLLYGRDFSFGRTVLAGLLLGSWCWAVCSLFGRRKAAGSGALALGMLQAVFGGGILPLPLLAPAMAFMARFTVFYWIMIFLRPV